MLKPTENKWIFDSRHFREIQLPDDIIQLLIDRVATLSIGSAQVLSTAAVIGFEFEQELLLEASGQSRESINRALFDGLQNALIEKTTRGYAFVHDRVNEALLQANGDQQLKEIHQLIADTLERLAWDSPQYLYARARHFFLGFRENNMAKVFQTSLLAGTHALDNFSNEEAVEFLHRALEAAKTLSLTPRDLSRLHELIGLAFTRIGRQEEAVQHLSVALEKVSLPNERAPLYYLLGLARGSGGYYAMAKEDFYTALRLLKAPFPRSMFLSFLSILWHWLSAEFRIRSKIGYGRATGDERQRRKLISKINSSMNYLGYVLGDELLFFHSVIRELHNVQFLGTCTETAKAHVYYSMLMGFSGLKGTAEKHGRLATDMAHQLGDQETVAYCELYHSVATEFAGDVQRSYKMILDAYPKVLRYSSAWDKTAAIGHRLHKIVAGKVRENLAFVHEAMPILQQAGDLGMLHSIYSSLFLSHQILGDASEAAKALQVQRKLPQSAGESRMCATFFQTYLIQSCLVTEEYGAELERAIDTLGSLGVNLYHTRNRFAVMGFARVEQLRSTLSSPEREKYLKSLAVLVRRSGFPNALTPLHLCLHYALKGAWLSILGKHRRALRSLLKAEKLALKSDNQWALWIVTRERARIAQALNDDSTKQLEAKRALQLAFDNGWMPMMRQISRDFGVVLPASTSGNLALGESIGKDSHSTKDSGKRGNYGRLLTAERNADVLLQINLASASSLDPQQQAKAILDELISVLGAERAFLFDFDPQAPAELKMRSGRDGEKSDLTELKGYSSTVVKKVCTERQAIIVSGTDEGEVLGAQSIVAHNLRSILAVPVMFRDRLLGVLYLDSTLAKGIFTEADLEIVTALANHIAIAVETTRNTNIEIENQAMRKDLEVTSAVQSLILPKKNTVSVDNIKMASFYKAANQSGGDWWWYDYNPARSVFTVIMGDVTGHGAGAAMISAAVSGVYHAFKSLRGDQRCIPDFLNLLNRTLFELAAEEYLLSMNAFEINLTKGEIEYWSAGAPPMLVIHASGEVDHVAEIGSWLGSSELGVGHQTYKLLPGDRIALFTDGLYELETSGQRQLGLRRLERLLKDTRAESSEKALNSVIAKVLSLQVPSEREDDISLVLVDYRHAS